jgi:hypothetical protein
VRQFAEGTLESELEGCAALARFFPGASQVRVAVQVTALRGGTARLREASVVEFATPEHAILVTSLPLEFADRVRLEGSRKMYSVDATVVGVRYHDEQKAVALKFLRRPCHWIMQL